MIWTSSGFHENSINNPASSCHSMPNSLFRTEELYLVLPRFFVVGLALSKMRQRFLSNVRTKNAVLNLFMSQRVQNAFVSRTTSVITRRNPSKSHAFTVIVEWKSCSTSSDWIDVVYRVKALFIPYSVLFLSNLLRIQYKWFSMKTSEKDPLFVVVGLGLSRVLYREFGSFPCTNVHPSSVAGFASTTYNTLPLQVVSSSHFRISDCTNFDSAVAAITTSTAFYVTERSLIPLRIRFEFRLFYSEFIFIGN